MPSYEIRRGDQATLEPFSRGSGAGEREKDPAVLRCGSKESSSCLPQSTVVGSTRSGLNPSSRNE